MGKTRKQEIDFEELDNVVADLILEKNQEDAEEDEAKEEAYEAMELDYEEAPEPKEEIEREAIIDKKPWRIVQRARKMSQLRGKERLIHEKLRMTKRFGRSITPLETSSALNLSPIKKKPNKLDDKDIFLQNEILQEIAEEIKAPKSKDKKQVAVKKSSKRALAKKNVPKPATIKASSLTVVSDVLPAKKEKLDVAKVEPKPLAKDTKKSLKKVDKKPLKKSEKKSLKQLEKYKLAKKSSEKGKVRDIDSDKLQKIAPKNSERFSPFISGVKVEKTPLGGGEKAVTKTSPKVTATAREEILEEALRKEMPKLKDEKRGGGAGIYVAIVIFAIIFGAIGGVVAFFFIEQ